MSESDAPSDDRPLTFADLACWRPCLPARLWALSRPDQTLAALWEICADAEHMLWLCRHAGIGFSGSSPCCTAGRIRALIPWGAVEAGLRRELKLKLADNERRKIWWDEAAESVRKLRGGSLWVRRHSTPPMQSAPGVVWDHKAAEESLRKWRGAVAELGRLSSKGDTDKGDNR